MSAMFGQIAHKYSFSTVKKHLKVTEFYGQGKPIGQQCSDPCSPPFYGCMGCKVFLPLWYSYQHCHVTRIYLCGRQGFLSIFALNTFSFNNTSSIRKYRELLAATQNNNKWIQKKLLKPYLLLFVVGTQPPLFYPLMSTGYITFFAKM